MNQTPADRHPPATADGCPDHRKDASMLPVESMTREDHLPAGGGHGNARRQIITVVLFVLGESDVISLEDLLETSRQLPRFPARWFRNS